MRAAVLGIVAIALIGCGAAPRAEPAPVPATASAPVPATTMPGASDASRGAPSSAAPGPLTPETELAAIQAEYAALEEAALRARQGVDPEQTARLRARAQDIAVQAKDRPTGLDALCWLIVHPPQDRDSRATLRSWVVQRAVADHLDSPHLDAFARLLGGWAGRAVPHGQSEVALRRIIKASPHESVRASAKVALATHLADLPDGSCPGDEGWEEALVLLQEVIQEHPRSPAAAAAQPPLTEMTRLQVGGEAPDFAARDAEGRSFRLSDYRGRVVVVEFWGFW